MAFPVAAMTSAALRWAPPTSSGMIPSMMPNLTKSCAVIFIEFAVSAARVES